MAGRTRIKFCGITSVDDARAATECGVDAIGLVLYPSSSRGVSLEAAKEICAVIPPLVSTVGLFVDPAVEEVESAMEQLGFGAIQLHGRERPEWVAKLPVQSVIKALRVLPGELKQELERWRSVSNVKALMLDTFSQVAAGGTGIANDWTSLAALKNAGVFDGLPPLILAGGLRHDSVGEVVRTFRPFAVDVSSGIEDAPGKKSAARMKAFYDAVHAADHIQR